MAIFLKQLEVPLCEEELVGLDIEYAQYKLTPIEIMPKTIVSDTSLFPYNCFLEKRYKHSTRYDSDNSYSEYLGIIYFTKAELNLIEEHGIDYFNTLIS